VATSPQHVDTQRVYTVRFVDVEDEVIRHEQQVSNGDAPAATRKRPAPYHLPRERHGASVGMARREPAGTDFSGAHSSGPELDVGDVLFFDHLAAHRFTQHATVPLHSATASRPVPLGLTRTAEYVLEAASDRAALLCSCADLPCSIHARAADARGALASRRAAPGSSATCGTLDQAARMQWRELLANLLARVACPECGRGPCGAPNRPATKAMGACVHWKPRERSTDPLYDAAPLR
jgi:hypothetical protein